MIKGDLFLIGIEVENMDEEVANLKANRVELTRGHFGAPEGPRIAFLEGPDGVEIELIEHRE